MWNILSVSYSIHSLRESFKAHLLYSSTVTSVCWSSEPSGVKNSEEVLFYQSGKPRQFMKFLQIPYTGLECWRVCEVPPNALYSSICGLVSQISFYGTWKTLGGTLAVCELQIHALYGTTWALVSQISFYGTWEEFWGNWLFVRSLQCLVRFYWTYSI